MGYITAISDCDVSDKARLAEFRSLRERVADLLKEDEEHSIASQLSELFWHDASFRAFNHARRTNTESRKNAAVAPLLASYLDNAYVQGEVLAVSRLTDSPAEGLDRGVVSLPTVIKFVRDNRACITRETYVCYDGLPFDCEAAAAAEHKANPHEPGVHWVAVPPSFYSQCAREIFDRLSGKAADRRRRDDQIKPGLLKWLERHLEGDDTRKIRLHRNKVLAHPADRASRGGGPAERLGVTLESIDGLHKRLLEIGEVLSWTVLGEPLLGTPIAIPQFDQFEGFDRVFTFPEDLKSLGQLWTEMTRETEDWSRNSLDAAPCKVPVKWPPADRAGRVAGGP
jgi:AbiU2